jgi:hypothetical protein
MSVRPASPSDCDQLARMRHALWADSTAEEHARELIAILEGKASSPNPTVTLVAEAGDQKLLGFLEAGLRSHADGCDPSHPVGFIEGWYVAENHRQQGAGGNNFPLGFCKVRDQYCTAFHVGFFYRGGSRRKLTWVNCTSFRRCRPWAWVPWATDV